MRQLSLTLDAEPLLARISNAHASDMANLATDRHGVAAINLASIPQMAVGIICITNGKATDELTLWSYRLLVEIYV